MFDMFASDLDHLFEFKIVKFPLASIVNSELSYFKLNVLDVFKKGFENVKLFCFVERAMINLLLLHM